MILRVLVLFFICPVAFAQGLFSSSVSLTVVADSLTCKGTCTALDIWINVNNESDEDIVVYALRGEGVMPAPFDLSEFCDTKEAGTGIAFAIYSLDGKQRIRETQIIDYYGQKRVTKQLLDSALLSVKTNFINSAMVLRKQETKLVLKRVSLKGFLLEPGSYYLQLVYYSGENISDVIDVDEVAKKSKAKLYRGCTFSSKIPLIIK